ncbi:oligosaccharide flippase family protein [Namhaeicola litoreus]|uniref:Oligosaccharide flippase family protein n=1 Tax=Namhaeicola litoreus TaxID=1052145 RepID=A0ABW3Y297_9FLAO
MGVVLNQTYKNTLIIFLGFFIGGINVLFLFTHFLSDDYYGLVTFLLSTANLLMPVLVLGMQNTIVKFFYSYDKEKDRDQFLLMTLVLPLFIILPLGFFASVFYDKIAEWISKENAIIRDYTVLIFIVAVCMGYFEVFYSWCRVHLKSVYGNFIKEIFARLAVMILLFLVYLKVIDEEQFILAVVLVYFIRMIIMMIYAFHVYKPKSFKWAWPYNVKEILSFSFYIILAGSAGTILLEIDKFMIPQMEQIAKVAYYSVGVYIASVISIPSRAMQQIINPITAKEIQNNNLQEVSSLYKKSASTLLVFGGLLFLLINCNVEDLYRIINKPQFSAGILVVLIVSIAEMIKLSIGTNGAILTNSKYYKSFFYFSIGMAVSVIFLNKILIEKMGINGAAISTLIVVAVFSLLRVIYVQIKMKMQPFDLKIVLLILFLAILYFIFERVEVFENPFFNIAFKSIFIVLVYSVLILKFKLSLEFEKWFRHLLKRT